jgi:hypothetical protein
MDKRIGEIMTPCTAWRSKTGTPDILNSFKEHGYAIYLKADVQALVDALAMAVQHGRIDDSETRMNLAFAALIKFKETGA